MEKLAGAFGLDAPASFFFYSNRSDPETV